MSNTKSIQNNEISLLAIVEILLAIGIYWGLAIYFDIYWHILVSIFVAPLFLLQSSQSIELGLKKFRQEIDNKYTINNVVVRGRNVIFRIIFVIIIWFFLKIFFEIPSGYFTVSLISFVIPIITNTIFQGLYSNIFSIVKSFQYGYNNIASNWFSNSFVVDFKQSPELVKGIENTNLHHYKISYMLKKLFRVGYIDKLAISLILIFIFPITILYRLSIKSTFWFYIPLLFVIKKPKLETSAQIGKFLSELYVTMWVKVRGFLASITLGSFFITHFNYYSLENINSPFSSIISLLYFDFSSLELWKIFQLLVAIITIVLILYANSIRVPNISNNIPLVKDIHISIIYYLNSLRNWLSLFYFLSAFIFLAVYFKIWDYKYVPNFLSDFFKILLEYIQYVPFS